MNFEQMLGHYGLYLTTLAVALISGFVPIDIQEVYLVWVAALTPSSQGIPITLLTTIGQMTSKTVMYLAAAGVLKITLRKPGAKVKAVQKKISSWRYGFGLLIFFSGFIGIPPFYWVTVAAGACRFKLPLYIVVGFAGRFLRYGFFVFFPHLIKGIIH